MDKATEDRMEMQAGYRGGGCLQKCGGIQKQAKAIPPAETREKESVTLPRI